MRNETIKFKCYTQNLSISGKLQIPSISLLYCISKTMLSRFLQWSIIGSILILVFGVWLVAKDATVLQGELNTKLESKFGFTSATFNMQSGEKTIEAFSIHPEKDGILYDAGFREGDIVLSHTKYKFYSLLYGKKGNTESIDILRGDGIASADKNRPTTIFLKIPN